MVSVVREGKVVCPLPPVPHSQGDAPGMRVQSAAEVISMSKGVW